jgi:cellulose synthase/poly-beta-1,6-N-acetylglucosamine synthase-like glycosyltransferase
MGALVTAFLSVWGVLLLVPALYLLCLTLAGLFYRPPRSDGKTPSIRFAILIPAHDEERLLPQLLASLRRLAYPRDLYEIFVVADNCADGTARVAAEAGARVYERADRERIGKGYALEWLLERIAETGERFDAHLFLDADCVVSQDFLAVMDLRLRMGQRVVQAYYTVVNPMESWVSGLRFVALSLMHYARPRGRELLGASCGIFGTGMVFRRSVLEEMGGWSDYGLVEDVELYLRLTRMGVRVHFAPEAVVWAHMPPTLKQAWGQNLRWERGRLQVARKHGLPLLWDGLRSGVFIKVDAAIEQLVPPLSLLGMGSGLFLLAALLWGHVLPIALAVTTLAALAGHVLIGLAAAKPPLGVYRSLAFAPWFAVWKLLVYARALAPGRAQWTRTQRPQ